MQKFKCIKTVRMADYTAERVFTEGKEYNEIAPELEETEEEILNSVCVLDDFNQEHFIGPVGGAWFNKHFETLKPL